MCLLSVLSTLSFNSLSVVLILREDEDKIVWLHQIETVAERNETSWRLLVTRLFRWLFLHTKHYDARAFYKWLSTGIIMFLFTLGIVFHGPESVKIWRNICFWWLVDCYWWSLKSHPSAKSVDRACYDTWYSDKLNIASFFLLNWTEQ